MSSLTPLDAFDSSPISAKANEEGAFVFSDVLPGRYSLIASPTVSRADAAYVRVTADGNDRVIDVATNKGATVSGRVICKARRAPPMRVAGRRGYRLVRGGHSLVSAISRRAYVKLPQDGGRFELKGLRGPVRLISVADRWCARLDASRVRGDHRRDHRTDGHRSVDNVVIVMTNEVGAIDVSLAGDFPDGVETVSVVVYPQDERRRRVPRSARPGRRASCSRARGGTRFSAAWAISRRTRARPYHRSNRA